MNSLLRGLLANDLFMGPPSKDKTKNGLVASCRRTFRRPATSPVLRGCPDSLQSVLCIQAEIILCRIDCPVCALCKSMMRDPNVVCSPETQTAPGPTRDASPGRSILLRHPRLRVIVGELSQRSCAFRLRARVLLELRFLHVCDHG
jgi:hypothetical protein